MFTIEIEDKSLENIHIFSCRLNVNAVKQGEEGQLQQFLVRATFSPCSRPSHLEIIALRLMCFKVSDYVAGLPPPEQAFFLFLNPREGLKPVEIQ